MASRNPSDDVSSSSDIRAVSRAADVLGLFGPETPELTASEVGEKIGLNRFTAGSGPPIIRQNPRLSPHTPPLVPQSM